MEQDNEGVTIRQVRIGDLADIFYLGEKLFTYSKVVNLYQTWDEHEVLNYFQSNPEYCFCALAEEGLVGFLLSSIIIKRRHRKKIGYLAWLGVDPHYKGEGVGGKLFDCFKKTMEEEGVDSLLIDTQADNQEAIGFFKGKGFGDPSEHIYMTMDLKAMNHD